MKIRDQYQKKLIQKYNKIGVEFGSILGQCYMGRPFGYCKKKSKFFRLEKKIIKIGFSPKRIDYFVKKALTGGDEYLILTRGTPWHILRDNKREIKEYEKVMKDHGLIKNWINLLKL